MEVARALSGWTVRSRREVVFGLGKVEFHPEWHDDGEKHILGRVIPAGLGSRDLDAVIDIVSLHPSTAQHLATKLCRRFIADEPPGAAVDRVASSVHRIARAISRARCARCSRRRSSRAPGERS